mgnify:CR=1 FL=1
MTKTILSTITILSLIILIILVIVFYINRKNKNIDKIINITGVLLSILSIFLTALISLITLKEADIKISITDGRYIVQEEKIYLVQKDNNKLELSISPDYNWFIKITNTGNKSIEKLRIKLQFDNIQFNNISSDNEYTFSDHSYGLGYYISQQYQTEEWIPPNGEIILPRINDSEAYIIDNNKKCYLTIYVYLEEDTIKEFKYEIELIKENN